MEPSNVHCDKWSHQSLTADKHCYTITYMVFTNAKVADLATCFDSFADLDKYGSVMVEFDNARESKRRKKMGKLADFAGLADYVRTVPSESLSAEDILVRDSLAAGLSEESARLTAAGKSCRADISNFMRLVEELHSRAGPSRPPLPFVVAPRKKRKTVTKSDLTLITSLLQASGLSRGIVGVRFKNEWKGLQLKVPSKFFKNTVSFVIYLGDKLINMKMCSNGVFQITGNKSEAHAVEGVSLVLERLYSAGLMSDPCVYSVVNSGDAFRPQKSRARKFKKSRGGMESGPEFAPLHCRLDVRYAGGSPGSTTPPQGPAKGPVGRRAFEPLEIVAYFVPVMYNEGVEIPMDRHNPLLVRENLLDLADYRDNIIAYVPFNYNGTIVKVSVPQEVVDSTRVLKVRYVEGKTSAKTYHSRLECMPYINVDASKKHFGSFTVFNTNNVNISCLSKEVSDYCKGVFRTFIAESFRADDCAICTKCGGEGTGEARRKGITCACGPISSADSKLRSSTWL